VAAIISPAQLTKQIILDLRSKLGTAAFQLGQLKKQSNAYFHGKGI
jgi:hypothetical protein